MKQPAKSPKGVRKAPDTDKALREHLVNLLSGGGAHIDWKDTFKGIPVKFRGVRPETLPYSIWDLVEHMRIAQWDILEFSRDAKHVSPDWPAGYWPKTEAQPTAKAWDTSVASFARDLEAMKKLVANPGTDFSRRFRTGPARPSYARPCW